MAAAVQGYEEVVVVLLDAGANIDFREQQTGATALTDAIRKGHVKVARILISRGADVNVRLKDGNSPLSWARIGGYTEVEKLLLKAGAK